MEKENAGAKAGKRAVPENKTENDGSRKLRRAYLSLLLRFVLLGALLLILFTQVFCVHQVAGNGMYPAIRDGDLLFAYRLEKTLYKDDVILYNHDGGKCIGRILGRPGDVITVTGSGTLEVNGVPQSADILFPTEPKDYLSYPYTVPEHSVFVLGDHRTDSVDSRDFGPVLLDDTIGKVITVLRRREI